MAYCGGSLLRKMGVRFGGSLVKRLVWEDSREETSSLSPELSPGIAGCVTRETSVTKII